MNENDNTIDDDLYNEAVEAVMSDNKASVPFLQRKLRIGYYRAFHLIDLMEKQKIIGPMHGSKPRKILEKNYNATTSSTGTTLSIKNLNNIIDEFKKLEKENFSIVEVKFKKVPNVINKFERKTFAKETRLLNCIHGIPLIIDKKVPSDEYWLKDTSGKISKFKI